MTIPKDGINIPESCAQDNSEIDKKIHTLETLLDFSMVLSSAKSLKKVFDAIMLTCMGEKGISVTSIMLQENRSPNIFGIKAVKGSSSFTEKKILVFTEKFIRDIGENGYAFYNDMTGTENDTTKEILGSLPCVILIPVHFHSRLIAILSCGPKILGKADNYTKDDISFLKLISSYSGIAISNLMGLELIKNKKDDLEKKLFEMEALEETRRALTSTLNLDMLCHALLLSLMGYLKSENGIFYISINNHEKDSKDISFEFKLMAKAGKHGETNLPDTVQISASAFSRLIDKDFIRRETESVAGVQGLLDSVNSSICFPLEHKGSFRGLCFMGTKAVEGSFYREKELNQAVMLVRQSISPIRNSIFHLELQIGNKILREAEEKARKNEERIVNILETANEGFIEIDFSGSIVNINQEICRMLGLPKDEIINKKIEGFIHADYKDLIKTQLENRKKGERGKYEASILSSSGEIINCLISATPIYETNDMSGKPSASFAMITDITRLRESEEKLKEFAKIVSSSNDMIALIDTNLCHKTINSAYERAFCIADDKNNKGCLREVFGEKQFRGIIEPSVQKCLGGENVHFRNWINLPSCGSRYVDAAFYPYLENGDFPSGAIIVMRDVTEIKILETNLQQAQKMEAIGALAGGIAHDFNNILSGILGYISLAQLFSESQTREYLMKAQGSCQRAADLIKQILTFARKNEEEMKPFALSPIIKETMRLIRASIPVTINIRSNIEESSKMILGNPTQIHQILLNLCTNAVHAMGETGGNLEIGLKAREWPCIEKKPETLKEGPYYILYVKDDGEGMSSDVLDRIFEPFFTTKQPGKGTGLGLSMSHGIVKNHGGEIIVESEPGMGSEFTVFLPIAQNMERLEKTESGVAFGPLSGKERILFVDDEETITEICTLLLGNLGYNVKGFTDPSKAVEEFTRKPDEFDLIITDQTMPGLTGIELSARIKKIRPEIPVIICSGFSEQLTQERLNYSGISSYIVKPITQKNLSETIRSILDSTKE